MSDQSTSNTKDEEPDGRVLVICGPAVPGFTVIEGSVLKNCEHCGCPIWRDPSQMLPDVDMDNAILACIPCGLRAMALSDNPEFNVPNDEYLRRAAEQHGVTEDEINKSVTIATAAVKTIVDIIRTENEFEAEMKKATEQKSPDSREPT